MDLGSLGASGGPFTLAGRWHLDVAGAVRTSLRALPVVSSYLRLFVGRFLLLSLPGRWLEFSVLAGALHGGKSSAGDFSGGRKVAGFLFFPDLHLLRCFPHLPL